LVRFNRRFYNLVCSAKVLPAPSPAQVLLDNRCLGPFDRLRTGSGVSEFCTRN